MLNYVAGELPPVYIEETETIMMSGYWLNLSAYGEKEKFDNDTLYNVEMPLYRAVTHKQQIKDAYKKGGEGAVMDYINKVTEQINTA